MIEFSFGRVADSGGATRALPGLVAASWRRRGSPHIRTGNRAYLRCDRILFRWGRRAARALPCCDVVRVAAPSQGSSIDPLGDDLDCRRRRFSRWGSVGLSPRGPRPSRTFPPLSRGAEGRARSVLTYDDPPQRGAAAPTAHGRHHSNSLCTARRRRPAGNNE